MRIRVERTEFFLYSLISFMFLVEKYKFVFTSLRRGGQKGPRGDFGTFLGASKEVGQRSPRRNF